MLEPAHTNTHAHLAVPGIKPGHIDRQKPAAANKTGCAKNTQRAGKRHDGHKGRFQLDPIDHLNNRQAADKPQNRTKADLQNEPFQQLHGDVVTATALHDQFDQRNRQEHGHRIVRTRFNFKRAARAITQIDPANTQQKKHRRRIG